MSSENRKPGIHIAWKTVTYRSVALLILAGAVVLFARMRLAFPQFTQNSIKAADNVADKAVGARGGMAPAAGSGISTAQQAHFTALDGTVRVKKGNGNSWVAADYNVPLEKGDVVQTGSEGMAKVVFNDGTSYTVKQDSLIVIEENSANDQQQTNVAVAVSTGTVDLSTATYSPGIEVAGDRGGSDGIVGVRNRRRRCITIPRLDQHEILMKKGTGEVTRNGETVQLANWEKVSFQAAAAAHGEGERNGAADADFAGEHGADFLRRGEHEGCGVFLDADGERGGLPAANLEKPLLFLYTGR